MATVTKVEAAKVTKLETDKPVPPEVGGDQVLVYVPPSQQNAQRPAAKPGEPVHPGTVPTPSPVHDMKMVPGKLKEP